MPLTNRSGDLDNEDELLKEDLKRLNKEIVFALKLIKIFGGILLALALIVGFLITIAK